jgi:hypothetical protein
MRCMYSSNTDCGSSCKSGVRTPATNTNGEREMKFLINVTLGMIGGTSSFPDFAMAYRSVPPAGLKKRGRSCLAL